MHDEDIDWSKRKSKDEGIKEDHKDAEGNQQWSDGFFLRKVWLEGMKYSYENSGAMGGMKHRAIVLIIWAPSIHNLELYKKSPKFANAIGVHQAWSKFRQEMESTYLLYFRHAEQQLRRWASIDKGVEKAS